MTSERQEQIRALLARLNPAYGVTQHEFRILLQAARELQAEYDHASRLLAGLAPPIREAMERLIAEQVKEATDPESITAKLLRGMAEEAPR